DNISADCLIVDLQDAVPLSGKENARAGLISACMNGVFKKRKVIVRINEKALIDEHNADLDAIIGLPDIYGIMPTMITDPWELDDLDLEISLREREANIPNKTYRFLPLIETPNALLQAYQIALSGGGRNIGLLLGHGDLFRQTGAAPNAELTLSYPRNTIVMAAAAADILAFDTPYTNISDSIGLERDCRLAKEHGFDGKCCLHPSQLSTVERHLRPTSSEVNWARTVEEARKGGELNTLMKKLNKKLPVVSKQEKREHDGMGIIDGQLVGPPHIKAAQKILRTVGSAQMPNKTETVIGRVLSQKLEDECKVGQILPNPYEITITSGLRDLWLSQFYSHDPATRSALFAQACGLSTHGQMPSPYMLSLYLCVTMSSTHGAIYHLGFRNAQQHQPICVGDTVHQRITVKSVRNTSDKKRVVITTHRELIRSQDGMVLFTVDKLELYSAQEKDIGEVSEVPALEAKISATAPAFALETIKKADAAFEQYRNRPERGEPDRKLAKGDLILHSFARPMGVTANLQLSTLLLVTHPIHLDHHTYDQGNAEGIVISGGLVVSQMLGAVARDISDVVWEELIYANNISPVSPTDTVSAISFVLDRQDVLDHPNLECLLIKSIGIKNLTPSIDLLNEPIPREIFDLTAQGVLPYNKICSDYGLHALEGHIIADSVRRIIREKK
ncbi:MAG: aldolase/citrate lyase family protein, partial [Chloroflexota bacterium]